MKRKQSNMRRNWLLILAILLLVLLVALIAVAFLLLSGPGPTEPNAPEPFATADGTSSDTIGTWTEPLSDTDNPPVQDNQVPDSGVTDEPEASVPAESDSTVPTEPQQGQDPTVAYTPTVPEPEEIRCEKFAVFSGSFVEDGTGSPVQDVAAILVTNQTDRFLDMATMTYMVDGREAIFVVTGLHPGRSAWVMEKNAMMISVDAVFKEESCVTAFRDDVITASDDVTIHYDGNVLLASNNTNSILENVVVYYKTLHSDGNFFGGISYMVNFGTLKPGASVEKIAGHFEGENSEIVRISWQVSQTDEAS